MANQLSVLLNHVVSVFEADPLVNTIVFRDDDVVDMEKENVYPIVILTVLPSPAPDQNRREYSISIEVLNQRDDVKFIQVIPPAKILTQSGSFFILQNGNNLIVN